MSPLKSLTLITRYMRHHETIQTVKECRWAIWWYLASTCSRPHCWLGLSDMHLDLLQQVQQKSHFDSLAVSTLFNNETQKQQHCGDQIAAQWGPWMFAVQVSGREVDNPRFGVTTFFVFAAFFQSLDVSIACQLINQTAGSCPAWGQDPSPCSFSRDP